MIIILIILILCYLLSYEHFNTLLDDIVTCPPNATLYNNLCYEKAIPTCIKKATMIDGICYFPDIFVCPDHYTLTNNDCVSNYPKPVPKMCPDGYKLKDNKYLKSLNVIQLRDIDILTKSIDVILVDYVTNLIEDNSGFKGKKSGKGVVIDVTED